MHHYITKNTDTQRAIAGFDVTGSNAQWGRTDVACMRFIRALRRLKPMRRQHLPSLVTT